MNKINRKNLLTTFITLCILSLGVTFLIPHPITFGVVIVTAYFLVLCIHDIRQQNILKQK